MNKIIISLLSATIGGVVGYGVREMHHRKVEKVKDIIDNSLDIQVEDLFDRIDDPVQKREVIQKYTDIIKEAYHANSSDEVLHAYEKMMALLFNVKHMVTDIHDDITEYLGEQVNETPIVKTDNDKYSNLIHPVKITEPVKENNDNDIISFENNETISEEQRNDSEETDLGEKLPEEEQPVMETSEVVPVEEVAVTEELEVSEVDETKFKELLDEFIRPLIDKCGVEYEDRLVKLADDLASLSDSDDEYIRCITKMRAIVQYQAPEKGRRSLDKLFATHSAK